MIPEPVALEHRVAELEARVVNAGRVTVFHAKEIATGTDPAASALFRLGKALEDIGRALLFDTESPPIVEVTS